MIEDKQSARRYIASVKYVLPEKISSEVVSGGEVSCVLKDNVYWKSIYFTPGSAELSDTSSRESSGSKFGYNFQMDIPGGSKDLNKEIDSICSRPIVLLIVYSDGEVLYCGGKNKKLRLQRNRKFNKVSETVISFEYWNRTPFYYYKA